MPISHVIRSIYRTAAIGLAGLLLAGAAATRNEARATAQPKARPAPIETPDPPHKPQLVPLPTGRQMPYVANPETTFRVEVGADVAELAVAVDVAPKTMLNVFLERESPADSEASSGQLLGGASGSTTFLYKGSPGDRVQPGPYLMRLQADRPVGGWISVTEKRPLATPSPGPDWQAWLESPRFWMGAVVSCAGLVAFGTLFLFLVLPRPVRHRLNELNHSVCALSDVIRESAAQTTSAMNRVAQMAVNTPPQQSAAPKAQMDSGLVRRLDRLLQSEPLIQVARLIRCISERAGGDLVAQTQRNFPAYLKALSMAENLRGTLARDASSDEHGEWDTLHRALGALDARHNPRIFLDLIAEATRLRLAEKDRLLNVLEIEEIVPRTGTELSSIDAYQVEQTEGTGNVSTLHRVIAPGYRLRLTGEVLRKPAIAVQLTSDVFNQPGT